MLLARFRREFPASLWCDPSYRTRDHIIPFGLFSIYSRALAALGALERVQLAFGTAHAIGMYFGKKDGELPAMLRADLGAAYLAPADER